MTFRSPSPKDDAAGAKPLVTWHQGGPGGNSFYGLFGEEGYFQVSEEGTRVNNATSWNLVANMIYLDSPAGSNDPVGFSTCSTGGTVETVCKWDDKSQAEAYAHTMMAFYKVCVCVCVMCVFYKVCVMCVSICLMCVNVSCGVWHMLVL